MKETVCIEKYQALEAKNVALEQRLNAILHELTQLRKMIFGSKSERFVPAVNPEQLELFATEEQEVLPQEEEIEKITYERKKKHPGRTKLPDNIPTEDIIIEPEEDTSGMKLIGEEVTETINYVPGVLIKRRYIRRKYAREEEQEGSCNVVIGQLPNRPIPKGIPEAGLLAYLFISKYIDHLPFYRQIEIFKRQHGWIIHKSTINDWFIAICTLLEPLYEAQLKAVMQTDYLQADESPIQVQESEKKGKTHRGYMWVYRNPLNGLVLFDYRKGRGMHGPKERLETFSGLLQCDGYGVYKSIAQKREDISLISCLAHIRRKFFEAKEHHPNLANYALKEIQKLYKIERECSEEELSVEQITQKRQQEAAPIFNELLKWVKKEQADNLSKGPIGKALFYAKNHLPLLAKYLDDGRILIDNNLIENTIRTLALGRKNYLFAGSHQAAQRTAMMYSFFASCKTMNVNPLEWMTDVLQRIGTYNVNQVADLLPHNWKKGE